MYELKELKLKNGKMLIQPSGEEEKKVGNVTLWLPGNSVAKGVVFGKIIAKADSIDDPDYEIGNVVMANRFNTGLEIEYKGETMNLLSAGNIIAVVKGEVIKGKNENIIVNVPHEEITESGLFLSRKATFGRAIKGTIEVVGDEVDDEDYQPGITAIIERNSATEFELGQKRLFMVDQCDIIGLEGTANGN